MNKVSEQYNLTGARASMADLSEALARSQGARVTHDRGAPEWHAWRSWRQRNGLGTSLMDSNPRFSFPSDLPPESDLEAAVKGAPPWPGSLI